METSITSKKVIFLVISVLFCFALLFLVSAKTMTSSNKVNFTTGNETTSPVISLISPEAGADIEEGDIEFLFNVSDDSLINSCSVNLTGDFTGIFNSSVAISKIEPNLIEITLREGDYEWFIFCLDEFGNYGKSETRSFSITACDDDDHDDGKKKEYEDEELILLNTPEKGISIEDILILQQDIADESGVKDSSQGWFWFLIWGLILGVLILIIFLFIIFIRRAFD